MCGVSPHETEWPFNPDVADGLQAVLFGWDPHQVLRHVSVSQRALSADLAYGQRGSEELA